MAAPYQSILQVPTFVPRNQEQDYKSYLEMMKNTEGSRAELAGQKMETLAGLLGRIPGFTEMRESASNLINSALKGELTETHQQVLSQQAAAQRISQGVQGGAGAGVNMSLASFGRAGLAAQQQALAQVPQFMSFQQNAFMGNIANDPATQGPSWSSWGGQLQADTRDVYESKLAQAKALHQVQQMNEQFTVQENQRVAAQQRMDAQQAQQQALLMRQSIMDTRNRASMANSSAWGGQQGMQNPFSNPGMLDPNARRPWGLGGQTSPFVYRGSVGVDMRGGGGAPVGNTVQLYGDHPSQGATAIPYQPMRQDQL